MLFFLFLFYAPMYLSLQAESRENLICMQKVLFYLGNLERSPLFPLLSLNQIYLYQYLCTTILLKREREREIEQKLSANPSYGCGYFLLAPPDPIRLEFSCYQN